MILYIRTPFGAILAILCATVLACNSDDSSSILADGGGSGMADADSATDGSAGSSAGAVGAGAINEPEVNVTATCNSVYTHALNRDCTSDTDCSLVDHDDCCGTIRIAIRKGTDAAFTAAEAGFHSCVPGCSKRNCFHPTEAEDLDVVTRDGQAIFAHCDGRRCTSVVANAVACVVSEDCPVGQICVTFASGPSVSPRRACRSNPCASDAPTCLCAASVCTGFGAGICSASGRDITCKRDSK
jgi:hypothetical protein